MKTASLSAVVCALLAPSLFASPITALDDYVAAPDGTYDYFFNPANNVTGPGYTAYRIDMRSQSWRSAPSEVHRAEWQHWVTVIVPDEVDSETAFLFVTGGSATSIPPAIPAMDANLVKLALQSNSVTVQLRTVPNQALTFAGEGFGRVEDEIIAYSFDKYMDNTADESWPALLPMVKSAVRAMDTTQEFVNDVTGGDIQVEDFVVSGASKRGWTTWLTAAADDRVAGIAPLVFDALNFEPQLLNHLDQYQDVSAFTVDGYSVAVHDYVDLDIFDRMLNTPEGQDLLQIIDPYSYLDRLDMPKYIVNSAGDEFFVPDSSQNYFHDLEGDNYLRYVPNTGHGLNQLAWDDMIDFYDAYLDGATLPEFTWKIDKNGQRIRVDHISGELLGVKVWHSTNLDALDWRDAWTSTVWLENGISPDGLGDYLASFSRPGRGGRAFFIELTYNVNETEEHPGTPIAFTTDISVLAAPEPTSWALPALGGVALAVARRRRRSVAA